MFDKEQSHGISMQWYNKPTSNKTWANLRAHFTEENKRRIKQMTAAQAGFHGANLAKLNLLDNRDQRHVTEALDDSVNAAKQTKSHAVQTVKEVTMYYCWTHGLSINKNHTFATCQNKAQGHWNNATASNMQGGSNIIRKPQGCQQHQAHYPK